MNWEIEEGTVQRTPASNMGRQHLQTLRSDIQKELD
jgi:hypothetical protein